MYEASEAEKLVATWGYLIQKITLNSNTWFRRYLILKTVRTVNAIFWLLRLWDNPRVQYCTGVKVEASSTWLAAMLSQLILFKWICQIKARIKLYVWCVCQWRAWHDNGFFFIFFKGNLKRWLRCSSSNGVAWGERRCSPTTESFPRVLQEGKTCLLRGSGDSILSL